MSARKRKAAALKLPPDEPDNGSLEEGEEPKSSSTAAAAKSSWTTAQHLVNETNVRTMLRSEDLLSNNIARAGCFGPVALAAALWVQNTVLLPTAESSRVVDWAALRETVTEDTSPITQSIAEQLPETIGIDKNKRRYLSEVVKKGGEGKKGGSETKKATTKKSNKKEWKDAAAAAASSLEADDGDEREPLEIIEDEDDYD